MFLGKITNQLTGGSRLQNAMGEALGRVGVTTVTLSGGEDNGKDLTDLYIVNRTPKNARIAVQIDPTTFACVAALIIVANSNTKVVGDESVPDDVVKYMQDKWENWEGNAVVDEMLWKSILDGQCFIQKDQAKDTINSVDFLAYDEEAYDFIKLRDPKTGELLGYKQQAAVINVPENWREEDFNALVSLQPTKEDFNFEPDEVINPVFLENDGEGESLVYKALDYVYLKKSIENKMPSTVKRAGSFLGVQVGNEQVDYGDSATDPRIDPTSYQNTMKAAIKNAADSFGGHEDKDTIAYPYGIAPQMIGNGQLIDIPSYLNYLKGEITTAILTPDSRFSSETNRAATEAQLGENGQDSVMGYLRKFANRYIKRGLFNDELTRSGKSEWINKVYLSFDETNVSTEQTLITIAQAIYQIVPKVPKSILINVYAKRFAAELQKEGINLDDLEDETAGQPVDPTQDPTQQGIDPNQDPTPEGIFQTTGDPNKPPLIPHETTFLNGLRQVLNEQGYILEE